MSFAEDLVVKLGPAYGTIGVDVFINATAKLPAGVGPYTALRDTGGAGNVRVHDHVTRPYRRPSCQLVVHATNGPTAKAKAEAAFVALCGVRNATVNGNFYLEIEPTQDPFDMGTDSIGRQRFAFNIQSYRQF